MAFPVRAQELQLHEQEIKAGLLYNFLKYVEWPSAGSQMTVCVFGDDPFQGHLQPMAGRTVNQREIAIREVQDVRAAGDCQLLFINADERDRWPQLKAFLAGKSVLTVSDFPGFAAEGGMIEFGHADNHISAVINMDAVTQARLHVQDRLLRLATVMRGTGR